MDMEFRPAKATDKDFLLNLRKVTMTEHLEFAGLFLSDEEHLERIMDGFDDIYLLEWQDRTIGMLKLSEQSDKSTIKQLQLLPQYQGLGLGKMVIKRVMANAANGVVTLSVLKHNPALHLYQRLGFKHVGEDNLEFQMRYQPDDT